ncbi:MAG TPA: hypothetical protein VNX25_06280, partial [Verrucomicrobiae bacterium]|nr:hypothetical protein [Verrucomicrobiae bacterium]
VSKRAGRNRWSMALDANGPDEVVSGTAGEPVVEAPQPAITGGVNELLACTGTERFSHVASTRPD